MAFWTEGTKTKPQRERRSHGAFEEIQAVGITNTGAREGVRQGLNSRRERLLDFGNKKGFKNWKVSDLAFRKR